MKFSTNFNPTIGKKMMHLSGLVTSKHNNKSITFFYGPFIYYNTMSKYISSTPVGVSKAGSILLAKFSARCKSWSSYDSIFMPYMEDKCVKNL